MPKLKALLAVLFTIFTTFVFAAIKEVEFNWNSPSILWESQTGYAPCLEPFYLKVTNCPTGTTSVTVNIYESSGARWPAITKANLRASFVAVGKSASEFSTLIATNLSFRRFYFIDVILTTSTTTVTKIASNAPVPTTNTNTTTTNPSPNTSVTITTTTTTITQTPNNSTPTSVTETTTTIATATQITKTTPQPVYAIPLKNEISRLEFLGSFGAAEFSQKEFKSLGHNIGFVTGLKFKFKPVSTNSTIGRFGLFPKRSRWAAILGTVINDLDYKSTDIKSAIFGLKPVVGLDYEFGNGAVGVTGGAIFGDQDTKSKLNTTKNIVVGIFFGLSFSSDVFQSFRKNIPASQNFPSTQNQ